MAFPIWSVSEAFERRFSRIEAQMAELDRRTRTSP
jgi:hypothetical protein